MRILSITPDPLAEIPYLNAGRGPGDFYQDSLPVHRAFVDSLPQGTAAIVVTSDLQGRETFASARGGPLRLLGEVVPSLLKTDIFPNLNLPAGDIGVLLAGDFYTVPALDRRGGSGDVRPVWDQFTSQFDWVFGVAGNHDTFGTTAQRPQFSTPTQFLDGDKVDVGGKKIAGISGIIGNPKRPWRRTEQDYVDTLATLLCDRPTITLMHDGPDVPESRFRGSPVIRNVLEQFENTLIVRRHSHWSQTLGELTCGTQVLNVDARIVILTHESSPRIGPL